MIAAAISTAAPTRRSLTRVPRARSIRGAARAARDRRAQRTRAPDRRSGMNRRRRCDRRARQRCAATTSSRSAPRRSRRRFRQARCAARPARSARAPCKSDDDPGVEAAAQRADDALDVLVAENAADGDGAAVASVAPQVARRALRAAAGLWATSRIHSIGAARCARPESAPADVTVCSPRSIAARGHGQARSASAPSAASTAAALSNWISPCSAGAGRSS